MALTLFNRPYRVLSLKICKRLKLIDIAVPYFKSVAPTLRQAQFYITLEEYVSTVILSLLLTAPFMFFFVYLFLVDFYDMVIIGSMLFAFIVTATYAGGAIAALYLYPPYKVDKIRRNLELNLPYAATHMATIAGTGVPMYLVFRIVGSFKEYGEIAKECRRIARNIEVFGYDTISAISDAASDTPAPNFKDLLWGSVAVIRSGGDMRSFLVEKARIYMENQKNLEEEYIDSLGLMAEMYTTIFVAGPILFVVMGTIMGSMGGLPLDLGLMFSIFIYILLPIASVGFIILVDATKPIGAT
jgi:flagellar protein FlaJ